MDAGRLLLEGEELEELEEERELGGKRKRLLLAGG